MSFKFEQAGIARFDLFRVNSPVFANKCIIIVHTRYTIDQISLAEQYARELMTAHLALWHDTSFRLTMFLQASAESCIVTASCEKQLQKTEETAIAQKSCTLYKSVVDRCAPPSDLPLQHEISFFPEGKTISYVGWSDDFNPSLPSSSEVQA